MDSIGLLNPYGFIYITTNLINGKRYIGQKKFDHQYKWGSYIGSGINFSKAVKKYGKENFIRNIVDIGYSAEELNEKEMSWIENYNAVESSDFYNLIEGGNTGNHLKKRNSIPIICLNNGMEFDSINDAMKWSGHVELTIKKTFKIKYNGDSEKKLIFRPITKRCCDCNKALTDKNSRRIKCDDCKKYPRCKSCSVRIVGAKAKKYCTDCATERERERKRNWKANKNKLNK